MNVLILCVYKHLIEEVKDTNSSQHVVAVYIQ